MVGRWSTRRPTSPSPLTTAPRGCNLSGVWDPLLRVSLPRSVYSAALREYVARHAPDEVTEGLDRLVSELGQPTDDGFATAAARRVLGSVAW